MRFVLKENQFKPQDVTRQQTVAKWVKEVLGKDPANVLHALRWRLSALMLEADQAKDFQSRLDVVEESLRHILKKQEDECLFVLVQMLNDRTVGYSATHALLCATTAILLQEPLGLNDQQTRTLVRAGMTMNMGMTQLQDVLSKQPTMVTEEQRDAIRRHPQLSERMLRNLGVTDETWLRLVREHHDPLPLDRPEPDVLLDALQTTDKFIARISPRATRRGSAPLEAARDIYKQMVNTGSPVGAAFIKVWGMYPPGSYVRLKSNETAIVVRRGSHINAPRTLTLTNGDGIPVVRPELRDTRLPDFAVLAAITADAVKVRVNCNQLLKMC